ncbi:hypothetical protein PRIPAC_78444 [Pristionchus pacificus]|nr:hypothetical protein PRIPAC_78444 [Pristionchus pacificus]
MSLRECGPQLGGKYKVLADKGDFFDLLGFPDEVIAEIFSYLPAEDRMRARLNKRLSTIEENSQYFIDRVDLRQSHRFERRCVTITNTYPFDFISRIAQNSSIGQLGIDFPHENGEPTHKYVEIIKEFRCIRELSICIGSPIKRREVMTDLFLLDLSRRCEYLDLTNFPIDHFSPKVLHNVYKSMSDGSVSVRLVSFSYIILKTLDPFLNILGITYRNGKVYSSRNIEVYKDYNENIPECYVNIFDGFSQISFGDCVVNEENDRNLINSFFFLVIKIESHLNIKALNRAKNTPHKVGLFKRIRMVVYPE